MSGGALLIAVTALNQWRTAVPVTEANNAMMQAEHVAGQNVLIADLGEDLRRLVFVRGCLETADGGRSWEKVLFIDDKTGCADLVMHPQNPDILLAAMWEHRRWPWFFESGGPGSGLHRSLDGGRTWTRLTDEDGLPKGDLGRICVQISPSEPNVIYALVEAKKSVLLKQLLVY